MRDSGFLTFIQFLEDREHARQAMVRRTERMFHGLEAEHHFERSDLVYASAVNLLNNERIYPIFPKYLLLCFFWGTKDRDRTCPEETRTSSQGLRPFVQSLIETCTITMYSIIKHEVFCKNF